MATQYFFLDFESCNFLLILELQVNELLLLSIMIRVNCYCCRNQVCFQKLSKNYLSVVVFYLIQYSASFTQILLACCLICVQLFLLWLWEQHHNIFTFIPSDNK